ncbi:hypothetical protein K438DRAFT_1770589 [Mycena galopus ATCC 62051]|nr:hypothetical protein K438DRAFT_1770589 [Mycena galopus ATCC 62051]
MKLILTTALLALANLALAQDWVWRVYNTGNCDHGASPDQTYPPSNQGPAGGSLNQCYNIPYGLDWNAVEIDNDSFAVATYCNSDCDSGGGASVSENTYCNSPPAKYGSSSSNLDWGLY